MKITIEDIRKSFDFTKTIHPCGKLLCPVQVALFTIISWYKTMKLFNIKYYMNIDNWDI